MVLLRHSQPPPPPLQWNHRRIPLLVLRTHGFFPPPHLHFHKLFTHALPTSTATNTPMPYSDPPPHLTYGRIFLRLSTTIFTKGFTQALPPSTSPIRQCNLRIPHLELRNVRFFRLSTTFLTLGFTQALPNSNVNPTPTPSWDSPPRVTYPTIFFRLSVPQFPQLF